MCERVHKMALLAKEKYPKGYEELRRDKNGCICEFKYTVSTGSQNGDITEADVYVSDIVDGINWYIPFGDKKMSRDLLLEVIKRFNENKFLKFGPHPTDPGTILEGAIPNRGNDDDDSIAETFDFMHAEVITSVLELLDIIDELDSINFNDDTQDSSK